MLAILISQLESILLSIGVHLDILHSWVILLHSIPCLSHVEDWGPFRRVINDIVVDIVVVDDVGDVASTRRDSLSLHSLLLRWDHVTSRYLSLTSLSTSETLTTLTIEIVSFIFTVFSHGIFS